MHRVCRSSLRRTRPPLVLLTVPHRARLSSRDAHRSAPQARGLYAQPSKDRNVWLDPLDVAETVVWALSQPPHVAVRPREEVVELRRRDTSQPHVLDTSSKGHDEQVDNGQDDGEDEETSLSLSLSLSAETQARHRRGLARVLEQTNQEITQPPRGLKINAHSRYMS